MITLLSLFLAMVVLVCAITIGLQVLYLIVKLIYLGCRWIALGIFVATGTLFGMLQ